MYVPFKCIYHTRLHMIYFFLYVAFTVTSTQDSQAHDNAAFSLLLPGRILYLSALLVQTKFRGRGNKAGALSGWNLLQEAGVAKLVERKHGRGTDKVRK